MEDATIRAATWLEQASAQVSAFGIPVTEEKRRITFRRLLLLYPLQGIAANIMRGVFYLFLGALLVEVGQMITDILKSQSYYIVGDLLILILIALAALCLRFWAAYAQNPKGRKRKPGPEAIRRALLCYDLGGFSASLIRIVFYVYTILAIMLISFLAWGDPKLLPSNIAWIIALAGFGVGLQHWAAALGTTRKNDTTKYKLSSAVTIQGSESSPIGNQRWQRIPDHGPDQNTH